MSTVTAIQEWQDLDSTHQMRFVKAEGQIVGAATRHIVSGTDPEQKVWCEIGLVQWEPWHGYRPLFTVTSKPGQPLSLSPNIVCEICGDNGEVRDGKWIAYTPALVGEGQQSEASRIMEQLDAEFDEDVYAPMVRRDLGDKVAAEEASADNKIYDLFQGQAEQDPDLERILAEEEEIDRQAVLGHAAHTAEEGEFVEVIMGDGFSKGDERKQSLRKELLDEVAGLILGDRNIQYGPPHVDFQRTADMVSAMWGHKLKDGIRIEAHEVAQFLAIVKLSRLQWSPDRRDNWTDLAGYAACGFEAYNLTRAESGEGDA